MGIEWWVVRIFYCALYLFLYVNLIIFLRKGCRYFELRIEEIRHSQSAKCEKSP